MKTDPFPAAILAGGAATRLRPLTDTIPKALIHVNGEPFIYHQLRLLKLRGLTRVVVCTGYLGEMIVDSVGDGSQFDLDVRYSSDGPILLGTGGAIKKARSLLGENFFILYGDSYLECDYLAIQGIFLGYQKLGLMTVFRNDGKWDRSNVEYTENHIISYDKVNRTERMHHIDYGLGILNEAALKVVPDNCAYDLATLYQDLLAKEQLAAVEVDHRFYEIGTHGGLEELSSHLIDKHHSPGETCL